MKVPSLPGLSAPRPPAECPNARVAAGPVEQLLGGARSRSGKLSGAGPCRRPGCLRLAAGRHRWRQGPPPPTAVGGCSRFIAAATACPPPYSCAQKKGWLLQPGSRVTAAAGSHVQVELPERLPQPALLHWQQAAVDLELRGCVPASGWVGCEGATGEAGLLTSWVQRCLSNDHWLKVHVRVSQALPFLRPPSAPAITHPLPNQSPCAPSFPTSHYS